MTLVVRVGSSEWCTVSLEAAEGSGYTVETRDIGELGLRGERRERIEAEPVLQALRDMDILVIVDCEYDRPHIVAVNTRDRRVIHYTVSGHESLKRTSRVKP